jgi:primosomal protein N' (replication factor Y) (superfamily II helicase)
MTTSVNKKLALVAIPQEHIESLVYDIPTDLDLSIGDLIDVPFRNKTTPAILIDFVPVKQVKYTVRLINHKIGVSVNNQYLEFLKFASSYYCAPLGAAVKIAIPIQIKISEPNLTIQQVHPIELPTLSLPQQEAFEQLSQIIKDTKYYTTLLHGVTGSGKTAVYMHLVQTYLAQGKQVLILLPEIALTSQMLNNCYKAFKIKPLIWHSKVSTKNKSKALEQIILGSASIIIGVRSALFLPYQNLGLIIVDEEHDQSYKQESHFCYNARDMAVLRGFLCKTFTLLGSATPSTETYQNTLAKKYAYVSLPMRFAQAQMPTVEILEMPKYNPKPRSWICDQMYEHILMALKNGNQVLLFLNRRGYAPLVLCANCGLRQKCTFCSAWLVMHKQQAVLKCHHCNHTKPMPKICAQCQAQESNVPCGPGIERIAEELKERLPNYKSAIVSRDNPYNKTMELTLSNFAENKVDILIGTQIITKGHHFPNLTMVGVIDADIGLAGENIRTLENTFQLLHQVGGRSGREEKAGIVCIQTYFPNSKFMQLVKENDFIGFMQWELGQRKKANLPPFSRAIKILISSTNKMDAEKYATELRLMHPNHTKIKLFGPVDARIAQINKESRIKMLLIAEKDIDVKSHIAKWIEPIKRPNRVRIKIDVDPYDIS